MGMCLTLTRVPAGPALEVSTPGCERKADLEGSVRLGSYDPPHERVGGHIDGEARGGRAPPHRGGGRLVRVPRGDTRAVCRALQRGRAVGLGAPAAADAGDPRPARKAPAGGRLALAAWFEPPHRGFTERARARHRYAALHRPARDSHQINTRPPA